MPEKGETWSAKYWLERLSEVEDKELPATLGRRATEPSKSNSPVVRNYVRKELPEKESIAKDANPPKEFKPRTTPPQA